MGGGYVYPHLTQNTVGIGGFIFSVYDLGWMVYQWAVSFPKLPPTLAWTSAPFLAHVILS